MRLRLLRLLLQKHRLQKHRLLRLRLQKRRLLKRRSNLSYAKKKPPSGGFFFSGNGLTTGTTRSAIQPAYPVILLSDHHIDSLPANHAIDGGLHQLTRIVFLGQMRSHQLMQP